MNIEKLKKIFEEHGATFDHEAYLKSSLDTKIITQLHKIRNTDNILVPTILKLKRQNLKEVNYSALLQASYKTMLATIPKVQRIFQTNVVTKQAFHKKISTLCLREFKRGMSKTSKTNIVLKGKKLTKEIQFALKNKEKNFSRKSSKEELDKKKKDFEDMEAIRQTRKLDFLINQTELYSHFVLNKNKKTLNKELEASIDARDPTADEYDFESAKIKALNAAQRDLAHTAQFDSSTKIHLKLDQPKIQDVPVAQPNLAEPDLMGNERVAQPKCLRAKLKDYQLRGLNWLVNLYNQGINGILADDMGLGKTIQSISFLGYLFETLKLKGPFLIVTPTSTLPNWVSELERFIPDFEVLKYYGNIKERKKLKFHNYNIVLTSYSLILSDEKLFQKTKWQYLILDEAQAIKSNKSLRWKKLLSIKSRNRLLLTGTPIQNNLKELWSLLHFIMPSLFDNLVEFEEWFVKMEGDKLDRLHLILKPFMLRREKKDVLLELKNKLIKVIYCNLSYKQEVLYRKTEMKYPIDFKNEQITNVLMNYRKICNHPSLYKRDEIETGLSFNDCDDVVGIGYKSVLKRKIPLVFTENEPAKRIKYKSSEVVNDSGALRASQLINSAFISSTDNEESCEENAPECDISGDPIYITGNTELTYKMKLALEYEQEMLRRVPILHYKGTVEAPIKLITQNGNPIEFLSSRKRQLKIENGVKIPKAGDLIKDSGKLETLDILLRTLYKGNHRVLVYFQMTKMMDLAEKYMEIRKYEYLRLDGSTKINDRKDLVKQWQSEHIFIFLLSTRAGGLGINLTAADTVIFYDSDWNPTIDKQAMDRVHRMGQLRDVTVYKLVCKNTVEEKIMEMASKKDEIQRLIIDKGDFVGADI